MSASNPKADVANCEKNITPRQARTLASFEQLPDSALIDFQITSILIDRSIPSLWRDVKAGRLPRPTYVGPKSPRLRVGTVRARMKGARDVG